MTGKISIKHFVLGIFLLIVLYSLFFPKDFIIKKIYPQKYWSIKVESLSKNIDFIDKSIYDLSKRLTTKNYEREVSEMTSDFMKQGIPQDSSKKLALKISNNDIKAAKLTLESLHKSLKEHKKQLDMAKIELYKLDNRKN